MEFRQAAPDDVDAMTGITDQEYARASVTSRAFAAVVDGLLSIAANLLLSAVAYAIAPSPQFFAHPSRPVITWIVYVAFYLYVFFTIGRYGRTLGDKALRLRAVRLDGGAVGYGKSLVRLVCDNGVSWVCFALMRMGILTQDHSHSIVGIYLVVKLIPLFKNKVISQTLPDVLAGIRYEESTTPREAAKQEAK